MEIIPLIEKGITLIEPEKEKKIGVYYISEVGNCLRKTYYTYFQKPHYGYELHKAFSIGSALHFLIQKALILNQDVDVKIEVPDLTYKDDQTGLEIHGRLDVLIKDKDKVDIVELKTTSSLKYTPIKEHFEQINYYLRFYPGAEGHLVYINKANKRFNDESYVKFKEFSGIYYDEQLFQASLERIRKLHEFLIKKQLPYPEGKLDSDKYWQCTNCPFREQCDMEEDKNIIGKESYEGLTEKYNNR